MSSAAQDAAAALVEDFLADEGAAEEETPSNVEVAAVETESVQQEAVNLNPDLPDEWSEIIDEPDFEEEAQAEFADDSEELNEEYVDPLVAEERKKRIVAEKKAAWLEARTLEASRKKWVEEINKYAPLADAEGIVASAKSRRAAIRQATAQHRKLYERITPLLTETDQAIKNVEENALGAARQEVRTAWGKPLIQGGGSVPITSTEHVEYQKALANAKTLTERIKLRLMGDLGDKIA